MKGYEGGEKGHKRWDLISWRRGGWERQCAVGKCKMRLGTTQPCDTAPISAEYHPLGGSTFPDAAKLADLGNPLGSKQAVNNGVGLATRDLGYDFMISY